MLKITSSRSLSSFFAISMALLLTACGGGGSGSSSTTTTTTTTTAAAPTLVLTGSTNVIVSTTPATLSATLKNGAGVVLPGVVVTFTTTGTGFGTFFPTSGTALTDSNGIASITLNTGTSSGADAVTATATVSGATVTSNVFGFTATGTTSAATVTLSSSNSTITASSPAALAATVRDSTGALVIGTVVHFATQGTGFGVFSPSGATALTDSTGIAHIGLLAGTTFGADSVTATATIGSVSVASTALGFTSAGAASVSSLTLATSSNSISASSPATLTATLKDSNGAAVPNTVITFATQGSGYGVFFPSAGTALTSSAGVATISLNAGTTIGADTVIATATVGGVAVSSSPLGYTTTAAPVTTTASSISFVSATPSVIAIHNTGGLENSAVIFTVRDSNGNALANQAVNFALTTSLGSPTVTATATSGANGTVTAQVQSGSVTTAVRVKATLASNSAVTAVSSQLVISTALPHQNGFSLSATQLNIEAFNYDGISTTLNVRMSDRYGNLVPDGTAVTFRTAGGVSTIMPSCVTVNSACSVTLTSSGTRPTNGRLVVLATAIGEESFFDTNGNGIYDAGEPFTDLPEAFIDANENGVRDSNEEFVDFNGDGMYTGPNGVFDGVLRSDGLPPSTINVRGSVTIVLSTSGALITGLPSSIALDHCVNGAATFPNSPHSVSFRVTDLHGNSMASGTTVVVTTSNGTIISSPTSFTVLDNNTTATPTYSVSLVSDAVLSSGVCTNTSQNGFLLVSVTSPKGVITTVSVPVSD